MTGISCRGARELLRRCSEGTSLSGPSPEWQELARLGVVEGTPTEPKVSAAGAEALAELELRAYRCDDWPLEKLVEQIRHVTALLSGAAHDAEFFLTELGPITPREALPYLRIVAVGLSNRRATPEELAEQFRQVWGMVEVIGGDPRDRLVAAELLAATGAPMGELYPRLVSTAEQLIALGATHAVASSAILNLDAKRIAEPPIDAWKAARRSLATDEMAALHAMLAFGPGRLAAFESFLGRLHQQANLRGQNGAALFLACVGADPAAGIDRVLEAAERLTSESRRPLLLAALLATGPALGGLSPAELLDWVHKAAAIARRWQLAATDGEFTALGVALVEGLPADAFGEAERPATPPNLLAEAAPLLALHAWVYRSLLEPSYEADLGATGPPARAGPSLSRAEGA